MKGIGVVLCAAFVVFAAAVNVVDLREARAVAADEPLALQSSSAAGAVQSSGCGGSLPSWIKPGKTTSSSFTFNNKRRTFLVHAPAAYAMDKPVPVVFSFHGWGGDGAEDEGYTGFSGVSDSQGFIVVYPDGYDDNTSRWGPWGSWNGGGTTGSPGPEGATCTSWAMTDSYCYTSCREREEGCGDGCNWTTCEPDVEFITALYDHFEDSLCIDTTREYATGCSNGGIFAYQLGVSLATRLAAIAPMCGSFMKGFADHPSVPVPVLDIHGTNDRVVPANTSLAENGWYYTPVAEIFEGWKVSNQCQGDPGHYATSFDGVASLYCVSEGTCSADVVRCAFEGGHTYFADDASKHGAFVWEFFAKHQKSSHVGHGNSSSPVVPAP